MNRLIFILFFGLVFFGCDTNFTMEFPLIATNDLEVNTPELVIFPGLIKETGTEEIVELGFILNSIPNSEVIENKIVSDEILQSGNFEVSVNGGFRLNSKYYYRAYVKTVSNTIYANERMFVGAGSLPPEIISFSPLEVSSGDVLEIVAKNFILDKSLIHINMDGLAEIPCDSIVSNSLFFTMPYVPFGINSKIELFSDIYSCISDEYLQMSGDWELIFDDMDVTIYTGLSFMYDDKFFAGFGADKEWVYYDFNSKEWHNAANFPEYEFRAETLVVNDRIFVLNYSLNDIKLWEYLPNEDNWVYISDYPGSYRWQSALFTIGNNIMVGPGVSDDGLQCIKDVWKYDIANNLWSKKTDFFDIFNNWVLFNFNLLGDNYVVFGGEESLKIFKYIELSESWELVNTDDEIFLTSFSGFVSNDSFYLLTEMTDELFQYDLFSGTKILVSKLPLHYGKEWISNTFTYLNEGYVLISPKYESEFPNYKLYKYVKQ